MKKARKLTALLIALIMMLAMAVPAYAAEDGNTDGETPTVEGGASSAAVENKTDHKYKAYQIFSGTQSGTDTALAGVEWGSGVKDSAGFLAALKADSRFAVGGANIFSDCTTAADVAEALGRYADNSEIARAFANVISLRGGTTQNPTSYLSDKYVEIAVGDKQVPLDPGYYLLIDAGNANGTIDNEDAYNSALLQITDRITIEKKYTVPTVDKDIIENNEHVEAADAAIGDIIDFEIVGTLPSNYDDYEFYRYIFRDTMSHGLELVGEYKIGENGYAEMPVREGVTVKAVNNGVETDITKYAGSHGMKIVVAYSKNDTSPVSRASLTIQFDDLKKFQEQTGVAINKDTQIVIQYSARLTQYATTGNGNDKEQSNRVFLQYSHDPNDITDPNKVKNTPEDVVLIFTYELDVTKIDGETAKGPNPTQLDGAEFLLYREENGKKEYVQFGYKEDESFTFTDSEIKDIDFKVRGWTETRDDATVLTPAKDVPFKIIGLDAGTYYLEEIKAPAGYNKLPEPVQIVISAELETDEDKPGPGSLTITTDGGEPATAAANEGIVKTQIENERGVILPTTGGIGTAVFYAVGTTLAASAAALLVFRRRRNAA